MLFRSDEEAYNTWECDTGVDAVYGTPGIIRCGGNPITQRLWSVQFMVKI